jgi:hypothetical protein
LAAILKGGGIGNCRHKGRRRQRPNAVDVRQALTGGITLEPPGNPLLAFRHLLIDAY